MFSSPWHLLLFDRLGVTIIGTLTIIGGKAVPKRNEMLYTGLLFTTLLVISSHYTLSHMFTLINVTSTSKLLRPVQQCHIHLNVFIMYTMSHIFTLVNVSSESKLPTHVH